MEHASPFRDPFAAKRFAREERPESSARKSRIEGALEKN
jgi:hypothetical protein